MTPEDMYEAQRATMIGQLIEAHQVTGPAASQLTRLWSSDFVLATDPAGRYQLATTTGEPPSDLVKARLASPEWSHFANRSAASANPSGPSPEALLELQKDILAGRSIAVGSSRGIGFGFLPR